MEDSILNSTKKILGLGEDYTAFDLDIITHINSVFSILFQLGVGPADGFLIEDAGTTWSDFLEDNVGLNMVKSYIFLKVRLLFDPPGTSFAIDAMNHQISEYEWRISTHREWSLNPVDPMLVEEV